MKLVMAVYFVAYKGLECLGYCNAKTRADGKNIIYEEIWR